MCHLRVICGAITFGAVRNESEPNISTCFYMLYIYGYISHFLPIITICFYCPLAMWHCMTHLKFSFHKFFPISYILSSMCVFVSGFSVLFISFIIQFLSRNNCNHFWGKRQWRMMHKNKIREQHFISINLRFLETTFRKYSIKRYYTRQLGKQTGRQMERRDCVYSQQTITVIEQCRSASHCIAEKKFWFADQMRRLKDQIKYRPHAHHPLSMKSVVLLLLSFSFSTRIASVGFYCWNAQLCLQYAYHNNMIAVNFMSVCYSLLVWVFSGFLWALARQKNVFFLSLQW